LITPTLLQAIISNITLSLPEGYELAVGNRYDSMIWYNETSQASLLTDAHGFLILMSLPLKDINRHYELYIAHIFPMHLFNNTYAKLEIGAEYLAVNTKQRTYFSMTDGERAACRGRSLRLCPADKPIFGMSVNTCILSLYLQQNRFERIVIERW
jgi:hypothetical protein